MPVVPSLVVIDRDWHRVCVCNWDHAYVLLAVVETRCCFRHH